MSSSGILTSGQEERAHFGARGQTEDDDQCRNYCGLENNMPAFCYNTTISQ